MTIAGDLSSLSPGAFANVTAGLRASLNCEPPACLLDVRATAASVHLAATLTIPDTGPGNSTATATAVAVSAAAALANPTALASLSSSLGVSIVSATPVTVEIGVAVPLAVAPPPPPSAPPPPPPSPPPPFGPDVLVLQPDGLVVSTSVLILAGAGAGGGLLLLLGVWLFATRHSVRRCSGCRGRRKVDLKEQAAKEAEAARQREALRAEQDAYWRQLEAGKTPEQAVQAANDSHAYAYASQIESRVQLERHAAAPALVPAPAPAPPPRPSVARLSPVTEEQPAPAPAPALQASPPKPPTPKPPTASVGQESEAEAGTESGASEEKRRHRKHRKHREQSPERLNAEDEQRFMARMERRDAQDDARAEASPPLQLLVSPKLLGTAQALKALQSHVEAVSAKAAFDTMDANRSGRVSADELVASLRAMGLGEMDEAKAEEMIKSINARFGSKRKALTFDIFCVAFASTKPSAAAELPAAPPVTHATSPEQVLNAVQRHVDTVGAKAVFDTMDANRSGRVSADELVAALVRMPAEPMAMDEAKAEEMIKSINTKFGSKRKALTFDIFCVAFARGTLHVASSAQERTVLAQASQPSPPPSQALPQLTSDQVLEAMRAQVDSQGARSAFDTLDANRSGRVSADELVASLRAMGLGEMDEAKAEEMIKSINARFGSKRKALTFDIFCMSFKNKGAQERPVAPMRSADGTIAPTTTQTGAAPPSIVAPKLAKGGADAINERIRKKQDLRTDPAEAPSPLVRKISFGRKKSFEKKRGVAA